VKERSQFVANLSANLLSFAVSVLIAVWYTPYLIRHLGVGAYGLIPLATSITFYFGLATITLNAAVGRFLTIALDQQESEDANRIFNTALVGNVIIVCLLFAPAIVASWYVGVWFNTPPGYERALSWLFVCIICSSFVTMLNSSFSLASFCRNRFDLSNTINIASNLIRISTVVVLFNCFVPQVWHVGIGAVVAALFSMLGSIVIWWHLTPVLQIQPLSYDVPTLLNLTSLGGWLLVSEVGSLLLISIDLIVVNKLFGAEAGGRYGAILQWSFLLRSMAYLIAGVFGATIFMLYGRQDTTGLVRYSQQAVKILGLTIALPIGLVCGFSSSLLHVWLGAEFVSLGPLMFLMTIHLAVNLGMLPLFNIRLAAKKVCVPAIVTCLSGVVNLGLALLLAGPVGWGMYGVAAAGAIVLTGVNLIFYPCYSAHIVGLSHDSFFRGALPNICIALGVAAACWGISHYLQIHSWLGLVLCGGGVAIAYSAYVYALALTEGERETVLTLLRTFPARFSFVA